MASTFRDFLTAFLKLLSNLRIQSRTVKLLLFDLMRSSEVKGRILNLEPSRAYLEEIHWNVTILIISETAQRFNFQFRIINLF